jgi:hypothetical protein
MNYWTAIHGESGETKKGTEKACKTWARKREGAIVLNNGTIVFKCQNGAIVKIGEVRQ